MPNVIDLANAIAAAEGATTGANVGIKYGCNNPMDIKAGNAPWNSVPVCHGPYGKYPSYSAGIAAGVQLLQENYLSHPGWTLEYALSVYAGNPPQGYIQEVANQLGVDPSQSLGQIFGSGQAPAPAFSPTGQAMQSMGAALNQSMLDLGTITGSGTLAPSAPAASVVPYGWIALAALAAVLLISL